MVSEPVRREPRAAPSNPVVERRVGSFIERRQLQEAIARWLDPPLAVLAFVALLFLILEFSMDLGEGTRAWMGQAGAVIWATFVATFLLEFGIAPSKREYLSKNWIVLLSLAAPPFRVLRVFRVARAARGAQAMRGFSTVRLVTVLNRSMRALGQFLQRGGFGYIAVLTFFVILGSGSAVFFFERGHADANITGLAESLWWAATIVTTINASLEPVTPEGRVVALLLRVFGMAIIGYVTAFIAVWLLGGRREPSPGRPPRPDLAELQASIDRLEALIREQHELAGRPDTRPGEPGSTSR